MAALVVAGITLPVIAGASEEEQEPIDIGAVSRAFAGNARVSVRAQFRRWTFTLRFLTAADEATFRAAVANKVIVACSGTLLGASFNCVVTVTRSGYRKLSTTAVARTTAITLEQAS